MSAEWTSDLPPRPTNFNRYLPEGYTITDKWGDDWILADGQFVVDGWYLTEAEAQKKKGGRK